MRTGLDLSGWVGSQRFGRGRLMGWPELGPSDRAGWVATGRDDSHDGGREALRYKVCSLEWLRTLTPRSGRAVMTMRGLRSRGTRAVT